MHEMSIAMGLLGTVQAVATEHAATRVSRVEVALGVMQLVVPEALQMAFEAACEGTPVEGAELALEEVPIRARCLSCGHEFTASVEAFACPSCDQADVDIIEGNDIILTSVTCETEENTDAK